MSKKYSIDGKPRKSGTGKFFLGLLLGFLMCVGTIAGLAWFAYENVSVKWVNETFNVGLDLGSQDINNKTIKELVVTARSVVDKVNTYTLNDLDSDFGIKFTNDKVMGLDISDVKNVPVKDLPEALKTKFANISAEELKDVISLEDMDILLNKTKTYYVNGNKLYEDEAYTTEVDDSVIKYTITDADVTIKKVSRDIEDGKVEFELRFLPLTKALGDFKNTLGDKITVGELVNEFNVKLPDYIVEGNEDKPINELEVVVDDLLLADFLGYTIYNGRVYKDEAKTDEITGIVATLAQKTVEELKDVEGVINGSTIADVLDYSYEEGKYYYIHSTEGKKEVTGIMKALAGTEVGVLSEKVEQLKLEDVLTGEKTGILKLVGNPLITEIGGAIQDVIDDKTLSELATAGVVSISTTDLAKTIKLGTHAGKTLGSLKIKEVVDALVSAIQ